MPTYCVLNYAGIFDGGPKHSLDIKPNNTAMLVTQEMGSNIIQWTKMCKFMQCRLIDLICWCSYTCWRKFWSAGSNSVMSSWIFSLATTVNRSWHYSRPGYIILFKLPICFWAMLQNFPYYAPITYAPLCLIYALLCSINCCYLSLKINLFL